MSSSNQPKANSKRHPKGGNKGARPKTSFHKKETTNLAMRLGRFPPLSETEAKLVKAGFIVKVTYDTMGVDLSYEWSMWRVPDRDAPLFRGLTTASELVKAPQNPKDSGASQTGKSPGWGDRMVDPSTFKVESEVVSGLSYRQAVQYLATPEDLRFKAEFESNLGAYERVKDSGSEVKLADDSTDAVKPTRSDRDWWNRLSKTSQSLLVANKKEHRAKKAAEKAARKSAKKN